MKEQILGAIETFKKIWFNERVSVDYKEELLASLKYVYKEHAPEFLYYFTLNELFGNQLDVGVERDDAAVPADIAHRVVCFGAGWTARRTST